MKKYWILLFGLILIGNAMAINFNVILDPSQCRNLTAYNVSYFVCETKVICPAVKFNQTLTCPQQICNPVTTNTCPQPDVRIINNVTVQQKPFINTDSFKVNNSWLWIGLVVILIVIGYNKGWFKNIAMGTKSMGKEYQHDYERGKNRLEQQVREKKDEFKAFRGDSP